MTDNKTGDNEKEAHGTRQDPVRRTWRFGARRQGLRNGWPVMTGFPVLAGTQSRAACRKIASLQAICRAGAIQANGSGSKRRCSRAEIPSMETTKDPVLLGFRETGATGLEPATSGVTGRFEGHDDWRRWTRNRSIHAAFRPSREVAPHG